MTSVRNWCNGETGESAGPTRLNTRATVAGDRRRGRDHGVPNRRLRLGVVAPRRQRVRLRDTIARPGSLPRPPTRCERGERRPVRSVDASQVGHATLASVSPSVVPRNSPQAFTTATAPTDSTASNTTDRSVVAGEQARVRRQVEHRDLGTADEPTGHRRTDEPSAQHDDAGHGARIRSNNAQ